MNLQPFTEAYLNAAFGTGQFGGANKKLDVRKINEVGSPGSGLQIIFAHTHLQAWRYGAEQRIKQMKHVLRLLRE